MGIFLALDLILFFVFWELMLVPMYFLIQGWGSEQPRVRGDEVLHLHRGGIGVPPRVDARARVPPPGRRRLPHLRLPRARGVERPVGHHRGRCCSSGFLAAFAIKAPLFPFHTWLPLVHTEAPTAGSVVLAGVILKMGAYGLVRFSFELFPQAAVDLAPLLLVLAVIGIIYGADRRDDADRLETRHRVLVGRAHGLRRARHLLAHRHRDRRRDVHDGQPPAHDRRAVPRRRHALRAPAHARDQRRTAASGSRRRCSVACSSPRCSPASACPASRASSASSSRCWARSCPTGRTRSWRRSA